MMRHLPHGPRGGVPERLNGAVSKTARGPVPLVGSNPTPSAIRGRGLHTGGVPERLNGRAWRARVPHHGHRGFESHPLRHNIRGPCVNRTKLGLKPSATT